MVTTSNGLSNASRSRLDTRFPVNSCWELTLENQETVSGCVYCTDEGSQTVVLQKPLVHTTLASEVRLVNALSIVRAVSKQDDAAAAAMPPLSTPLAKVQKKALEERERKAIKLAEESFRHINQKATPEGQNVFDRLLKACNVVVWKNESILVLNQIQVDPPYGPGNCKIVQRNASGKNSLDDGSLDRVKKIVAAGTKSTGGP